MIHPEFVPGKGKYTLFRGNLSAPNLNVRFARFTPHTLMERGEPTKADLKNIDQDKLQEAVGKSRVVFRARQFISWPASRAVFRTRLPVLPLPRILFLKNIAFYDINHKRKATKS
jgi:hypothetical protein